MPKTSEPALIARYIGNGTYAIGVPACDITQAIWDTLTEDQKDEVLVRSDLYKLTNKEGQ